MEEISDMLRKEKVEIDGLYDELNNCKEFWYYKRIMETLKFKFFKGNKISS